MFSHKVEGVHIACDMTQMSTTKASEQQRSTEFVLSLSLEKNGKTLKMTKHFFKELIT